MNKNTIKIDGRIRLQCFSKDGKLKWDTGFIKNLITSAGKAQVALLIGQSGNLFTYLAVGTSSTSPSASDTALAAEIVDTGLARAAGTVSRVTTSVTNDTYQVTYTWTATGSKTVQEVGVFNAASVGVILGHALTGAKTVANTDVLLGTYQVQFS